MNRYIAAVFIFALFFFFAFMFYRGTAKASHVHFHQVTATDNSFSLQLPTNWKIVRATWGDLRARSPQGEELFFGKIDIPENETVQRLIKSRASVISEPLSPAGFMKQLVPRLNPAMEKLRILNVKNLPNSVFDGGLGKINIQNGIIVYDYEFNHGSVKTGNSRVRGIALIATPAPGTRTGLGYWTAGLQGIEAPVNIFRTHTQDYAKILLSMKPNLRVISAYYQGQQNLINSFAAQKQALANAIQNYGQQMNQASRNSNQTTLSNQETFGKALKSAGGLP